jgi:hypothetical protein
MPMKIDLDLLKSELSILETRNNWLDINPETKYYESLIKNREHLLEKFADSDGSFSSYNQIVLTEFDKETYVGISEQTVDDLENTIRIGIATYFPNVIITNLTFNGDPDNNTLSIQFSYTIANTGESDNVILNLNG